MKRVFAHIGFSFAITLLVLSLFQINAALVILVITGVAFAVSLIIKRTRNGIAVPLCMFSAMLACIIFITDYYGVFLPQAKLDNVEADAEFYIVDLIEEKSGGYYYTVKTKYIDAENAPQSIKIDLKSKEKIDADYYQVVKGRMKFSLIAENGFNSYGSFGKGIFVSANLKNLEKTDDTVFSFNKSILELRENIINLIRNNIDDKDNASVIIALVTGDKSYMSSEIRGIFRDSGTSHLMAVSGLHLSVFAGTVYFILKKIRLNKNAAVFISLSAVLFYAALTGFSKSVVRAGIMMAVMLIGKLFKEKSDSLNSLGLAVFVICLNPYAVTDSGALLTVTAVLGLIIINPIIYKLYMPKSRIIRYPYRILTASVSAFISTFPVIYFTFGFVSIYGVFLNIIMIPIAQAVLIASLLKISVFWINPLLFLCASVADFGASLMISICRFVAALPFAVVGIGTYVFGFAIAAVFLLFGIAFLISSKNIFKHCSAISAAVFTIIILLSVFVNYDSVYVREINGYSSTAVIIYNRTNAAVIGVNDSVHYNTVNNLIKSKNLEIFLIVDTGKNNYSEKLSEKYGTVNYVSESKNIAGTVKCENFYKDCDFDVDLWQSLNVKYKCTDYNTYINLKIYNFELNFAGKSEYANSNAIILDNSEDYDIVYTVDKNGCAERRLNEWLK